MLVLNPYHCKKLQRRFAAEGQGGRVANHSRIIEAVPYMY
jgi:hypothetical protein